MRAYYINLDRDIARRVHIEAEIAARGLVGIRVPAVDGRSVELPSPLVDERAFRRRHHALLRPGEVGCYLSHVNALTAFLSTADPFGLILEDDAVLGPEAPEVLLALARVRESWDVVKLYATHPSGILARSTLATGHRLVSLLFRHASSAAYVVNRASARRLLDKLLPMTVPYDHEFERGWKYGLRIRTVMPFVAGRKNFPSSITTGQHKPWYAQGGVVLFRGANDVARVWHELAAPVTQRQSHFR